MTHSGRSSPINPPLHPQKRYGLKEGRVGTALNSIISNGCIISGGNVRRSILSPKVMVHSFAEIEDSILLEGVDVGRNAKIKRTIIDKEVQIPQGWRSATTWTRMQNGSR